ncbi:MAG TPA: 2-oxo acid dehydrogenase subunit E2 [Candidatus Limosilactobacillus merdipullorum]|uniref:Dihydrolipoamide acetyltransferase component of pyruvate dehydrogenase complex n=1 Tax=Candidatus Limosilactobacillus merdipullorum TaxID=2838653 RepID=A0A9D1QNS2_9LACO|nr:2-oxo acid dehydrogenase subunit E2 [Candidatus Limosilactobacillus merdipullorum]
MSEKYQLKLPDIGEGIAEGTVGEWHVKAGDQVKKDGDLVQIENDKSVEEIPSPVDGTVTKILVQEGETAEVGQALVELTVADGLGNVDSSTAADQTSATPDEGAELAASEQSTPATSSTAAPAEQDHHLPVLAMPAVRKYARDHSVDLTQIKGTGRHGQILRSDVDAFLENDGVVDTSAPEKTVATATAAPAASDGWPEHAEKMSPVRKATAKAMIKSVAEIPMINIFDQVTVEKLWNHRNKYKELAKKHGVHLTFMAYLVKALAVIMKEFPVFNAKVDMANHEIHYRDYVNVGIATDTDHGLYVPNIKHADTKSLFEIAGEIMDNTEAAQAKQLTADQMAHTGMTISNIGSIGGGYFTPLINWPEVAILGMGRIAEEPIINNGRVTVGKVLKLSLTVDHRIIDGGTAQRAMNRLKELLADPELLLMEA